MPGPIALLLVVAACGRGDATTFDRAWRSPEGESCAECHARINPGLVADHEASSHRSIPLLCEDCHGTDHDKIFSDNGGVPPTVCATCHADAFAAFAASRHGQRLKGGKLDALLHPQMTATGGCTATNGCHSIQQVYPDQSVGRCGTCHATHAFGGQSARDPQVCIGCHEGIDHPQHRAWLRSAHSHPSPTGKRHVADCVECHTAHDVSGGITHGLPPFPNARVRDVMPRADPEEFAAARATMVARCRRCHSERIAKDMLARADWWRVQGAQMLQAGADVVRALHRDGLLDPPLEDRPPNPVAAYGLRLGGLQIFDQSTSRAERLYYEMHFQHYPALWRASYHADPERVVWHANDALKSALDRLRAIHRERRMNALLAEPNR
ncbi:MAG: multiheme c-type cytochrome [Planctomycetota bacterium]